MSRPLRLLFKKSKCFGWRISGATEIFTKRDELARMLMLRQAREKVFVQGVQLVWRGLVVRGILAVTGKIRRQPLFDPEKFHSAQIQLPTGKRN